MKISSMNYFNSYANNIHPDIIIESKFHSLFEKNCIMVIGGGLAKILEIS